MKVSVILAHPDETSFNHALAERSVSTLEENGHEVCFHDLYGKEFDPVLPASEIAQDGSLPAQVRMHCDEISRAGGIILVHPNWWGQPPAILKGWVDRVLRPGVAYRFREGDGGEGIPEGLLRARAALVFNTSNTSREREQKAFGDPLETLWKNCIFDLCGVPVFYRRMFRVIVTSTESQRREWLRDVAEAVNTFFPKCPEGGVESPTGLR